MIEWTSAFGELPLIAILRGVTPDAVVGVGEALKEAGFRIVEVPLNSPDPLRSIALLSERLGDSMIVGGGTILAADQVQSVYDAGGRLAVAPNVNEQVAERASALDMTYCPGVMTPTEAFHALGLGAAAIKLFPAELIPPVGLKAMKAVLPKGVQTIPVGGITPDTMGLYIDVGASGFGLGSALYRPGDTAETTYANACEFVSRYRGIAKAGQVAES